MSFDRLAPFYRWMEDLCAGSLLERCRAAHLAVIPAPSSILIVGEGHGRTLAACRRQFPNAQIFCIEASSQMIAQAQHNLTRHNITTDGITFICADVFEVPLGEAQFDLIITHFVLDCFDAPQLQQLVPRLASAARPDAGWLIADFQYASAGWRRWRTRIIIGLLYAFFRRTTALPAQGLVPADSLMEVAGFVLCDRQEFDWQLLKSDWWQRQPSPCER